MLPTAEPFLYTVSATATDGVPLADVEGALLAALDAAGREGITDDELQRAKAQLRARMIFDDDSVTNVAHQLGYFDTIGSYSLFERLPSLIAAVTLADVNEAARRMLTKTNRTIGWFDPLAPTPGLDEGEA